MAWFFSILHIILALSIGYVFKRVVRKLTDLHICNYLNEMVSTYEFSTFVFELAVFGRVYGFNTALLAVFCLLVAKNYKLLFQGRTVNPCGSIEHLFTSSRRRYVLMLWVMQLLGAYFSYFYVVSIWQLSQSYHHLQHLKYGWNPQPKVGLGVGFIIEFSATFLCHLIECATRKNGYESMNPTLSAVTCVAVTYLFAETTGVWMNPALATVHLFQLENTLGQNILVFWLAPLLAASLAYQCNNAVNVTQNRTRKIA